MDNSNKLNNIIVLSTALEILDRVTSAISDSDEVKSDQDNEAAGFPIMDFTTTRILNNIDKGIENA